MAIHASANVAVGFALLLENEGDSFLDILGVRSVIRVLSMGQEGHDAEAHDSGLFSLTVIPRSLGILRL